MKAKLGDYVKTKTHNHRGRVTGKALCFADTSENMNWFNGQRIPIDKEALNEPWYSILCVNGGAVLVAERDIECKEEPYDLNNLYSDEYFED